MKVQLDAVIVIVAESGRNEWSAHGQHIQPGGKRMNGLARDGTTEPVSQDEILRREREHGNIIFPCSVDHEQD